VGDATPDAQVQLFQLFLQQLAAQQQEAVKVEFPKPQCHFAMGVTSGTRRPMLTAADVMEKAPEAKAIDFVEVIDVAMVPGLIKEREASHGIDLSEDTINAERAMEATLEKTSPRLIRELEIAQGRKKEYASKRAHWEWAEMLRGREKDAYRVDRSLKKPKKEADARQAAMDKAFAEKRKASDELMKIQERLRKAEEDERRARGGN
jgi:hypothetical protein